MKNNFWQQAHFVSRDPGLVWKKDKRVMIDPSGPLDNFWALTPNVVKISEGYRMFYTGVTREKRMQGCLGYILSATSFDGVSWIKDTGISVDNFPGGGELWVLCPDVISLPDGRWRMYFQAKGLSGFDKIFSAVSADAFIWQMENGIRFSDPSHDCGSPRCLILPDGRYRLYFHFRNNHEHHIMSAVSRDGLEFVQEPGVRITRETELEAHTVYAPEVLQLGTGGYRLYYAAWADVPRQGRILSAHSDDGLTWQKDGVVCVDVGGCGQEIKVSEPCVMELSDGTFRMYYEACDAQGDWRIFSATA